MPVKGEIQRWRLIVSGVVQGVGFRPFVYRQAVKFGVQGWVRNNSAGVEIEIEAASDKLENFRHNLPTECPALAVIHKIKTSQIPPLGETGFKICASGDGADKSALILPDIAVCSDCVGEIFAPGNRRYGYPFTNCTNCGPRFSIITGIPYDRKRTTMDKFPMCGRCREEYENPADRRFHAQPIACPDCGPQIALRDKSGKVIADRNEALLQAAEAVRHGGILALKGLGGYQLIIDARNEDALRRLRSKKRRPHKPLAMMFPDFSAIERRCEVSALEAAVLLSAQSPIVLLKAREGKIDIAYGVSCGNPYWGVMLPYTPLHHLLMRELGFPVVATSGNLAEEPMCLEENEALKRLAGMADCFLTHDRPIARVLDDSVVREAGERMMMLRRARGYSPLPIDIPQEIPSALAVGAEQKNTIAFSRGNKIFLSQHLGDLENGEAFDAFKNTIRDFQSLYGFKPGLTVKDLHPDYLSTKFADKLSLYAAAVQHHHAHILACLADNGESGEMLGAAWDGSGYGEDGTVWGGEFLQVDGKSFKRLAHLRQFRLPGGEKAVREPRRCALGMLFELYGEDLFRSKDLPILRSFTSQELEILQKMLNSEVNSPLTSSAGRLFDGAAALLGLCSIASFEGQAAMELEFAAEKAVSEEVYPFKLMKKDSTIVIDWQPSIESLIGEKDEVPVSARKFHNTMAEIVKTIALRTGAKKLALSGGCFQNRLLLEETIKRLKSGGITPLWHRQVPPNDGGIALGQAIYAGNLPKDAQ